VKGEWEERFERACGFWRGFVDDIVNRYLDCGLYSAGFARAYCDSCKAEFLVAFSCQARGFCPSCAAKRAATFGALLVDEVLEDIPHAMWTFTIPKKCFGHTFSTIASCSASSAGPPGRRCTR
jgi:hypothetical protein